MVRWRLKKEFEKATDMQKATAVNFSALLDTVAKKFPKMRIRFSTSNPQDMTLDVIETVAKHKNICNHIHLPVQSGSNRILKEMNRLHTIEEYIALIDNIRRILPDCAISQDMISGFPTETEEDHQATLDVLKRVQYDFGYMYSYSERPGTMAARKLEDDVPEEVKKRRLAEIIAVQRENGHIKTRQHLGKIEEVLIEGSSKKSDQDWMGRNSQNAVVIFAKGNYTIGDLVRVKITDCTSATLLGEAIELADN